MYRQAELIDQIRKKPTLWDPQYKHGADKDLRDKQWVEVAMALFPNWLKLDLADKNEKLYEIKRRWKNIRDYYRKESKKWKGKKYMYKDLLRFLDSQDEAINSEATVKNEIILGLTDQCDQEMLARNDEIAFPCVPTHCLTAGTNQDQPPLEEVEPSPPKKRMREDDEVIDEDKSFLLSLLPEMRKLDGRQKIDFKITVLNDLRQARYSSYSEDFIEIKEENTD